MPNLPSLLKKYDARRDQYVKLGAELAELRRQILNAGKSESKRRPRATKQEIVEVIRETVKVLREAGEPLPRREIAARLGITPWAVHYRLQKAIRLKFVEKVGMGRYRMTSVVPLNG